MCCIVENACGHIDNDMAINAGRGCSTAAIKSVVHEFCRGQGEGCEYQTSSNAVERCTNLATYCAECGHEVAVGNRGGPYVSSSDNSGTGVSGFNDMKALCIER